MTVSEYRKHAGLTLEALGELIGKSKGHVHAIEQANRCSAKVALAIEGHSKGLVDAAALNEDVAAARRAAA